MCGRFTQAYTWAEVHEAFSLLGATPANLRPRYNVSPTDEVDVIRAPRARQSGYAMG